MLALKRFFSWISVSIFLVLPGWVSGEEVQSQLQAIRAELAEVKLQAAAAKIAVDQGAFNAGDNTWVILSSLLVLGMTIPPA
mgnify:CR=1 FL=1